MVRVVRPFPIMPIRRMGIGQNLLRIGIHVMDQDGVAVRGAGVRLWVHHDDVPGSNDADIDGSIRGLSREGNPEGLRQGGENTAVIVRSPASAGNIGRVAAEPAGGETFGNEGGAVVAGDQGP